MTEDEDKNTMSQKAKDMGFTGEPEKIVQEIQDNGGILEVDFEILTGGEVVDGSNMKYVEVEAPDDIPDHYMHFIHMYEAESLDEVDGLEAVSKSEAVSENI